MILDVEDVLDEIGAEDDHFIAGIQKCLEQDVQSSTGAHGHYDVRSGPLHIGSISQMYGDLFTDFGPAGIGHVPVDSFLGSIDQITQFLDELRGRREVGIAEREIENLILAVDGLETVPLLEHLPDPRGAREGFTDTFGNGQTDPSWR